MGNRVTAGEEAQVDQTRLGIVRFFLLMLIAFLCIEMDSSFFRYQCFASICYKVNWPVGLRLPSVGQLVYVYPLVHVYIPMEHHHIYSGLCGFTH